jgi:hypothetical protein
MKRTSYKLVIRVIIIVLLLNIAIISSSISQASNQKLELTKIGEHEVENQE